MRTSLTVNRALIIVLLTVGCYDSNGKDDGRDSGSGVRDETIKDYGANENNEDADVRNECQKETELKLEAILNACTGLVDCCYCSCELTGKPGTGCYCQDWLLTRDLQARYEKGEPCEGGALNTAITCLNDKTSCQDQTRMITNIRCSN